MAAPSLVFTASYTTPWDTIWEQGGGASSNLVSLTILPLRKAETGAKSAGHMASRRTAYRLLTMNSGGRIA